VPAIGAAVGGMRDLIEEGKTGFLFNPGDEHGARRALALAANMNDTALASMREATAEHARRRCDAADEAIGYLRVLDQTSSNLRALHAAE
jgi:glycosyltransferase involved in cell wall biosynthesis